MSESPSVPGGYYIGADGTPHDAHGNRIGSREPALVIVSEPAVHDTTPVVIEAAAPVEAVVVPAEPPAVRKTASKPTKAKH